jgi:hypothetical protein
VSGNIHTERVWNLQQPKSAVSLMCVHGKHAVHCGQPAQTLADKPVPACLPACSTPSLALTCSLATWVHTGPPLTWPP